MNHTKKCSTLFAILLACSASTLAQVKAQTPPTQEPSPAPTLPAPPPPPPPPIVDPAKELTGAALVEALRKGGFVLYMRHAETGTVTEKCEQSNLSAIGEDNARKIGVAMRVLKIPVGMVLSSQPCRTQDTARLLDMGLVEVTEDLNPTAPREGFDIGEARSKRLNEPPAKGANTVLVSHLHGSRKKAEWLHLEMGEIIVFRPQSNARAEPVARIRVEAWAVLKSAVAADGAR